jgi:uncharacterized protein YggE
LRYHTDRLATDFEKRMRAFLLLAVSVLLAPGIASAQYASERGPVIAVKAWGEVEVKPDTASLRLMIRTGGDTLKAATDQKQRRLPRSCPIWAMARSSRAPISSSRRRTCRSLQICVPRARAGSRHRRSM